MCTWLLSLPSKSATQNSQRQGDRGHPGWRLALELEWGLEAPPFNQALPRQFLDH